MGYSRPVKGRGQRVQLCMTKLRPHSIASFPQGRVLDRRFHHGIYRHSRLSSRSCHGQLRRSHSRRVWCRPADRFGSLISVSSVGGHRFLEMCRAALPLAKRQKHNTEIVLVLRGGCGRGDCRRSCSSSRGGNASPSCVVKSLPWTPTAAAQLTRISTRPNSPSMWATANPDDGIIAGGNEAGSCPHRICDHGGEAPSPGLLHAFAQAAELGTKPLAAELAIEPGDCIEAGVAPQLC
jgi:hypothetical protein